LGAVIFSATVVRVDPTRVLFEHGKRLYGLALGENLKQALAKPLPKLPDQQPFVPTRGKIMLELHEVPWPRILEWFSGTSRLPILSDLKPLGTFTFIPPRDENGPRCFTIPEIAEALNDGLRPRGLCLVRRRFSYELVRRDAFLSVLGLGKLLRIDDQVVYFQVDRQAYGMRMGQTFSEALAQPLSPEEITKLGLKLLPVRK
jgi:hypothetical protein